jgi:hypothetical protein
MRTSESRSGTGASRRARRYHWRWFLAPFLIVLLASLFLVALLLTGAVVNPSISRSYVFRVCGDGYGGRSLIGWGTYGVYRGNRRYDYYVDRHLYLGWIDVRWGQRLEPVRRIAVSKTVQARPGAADLVRGIEPADVDSIEIAAYGGYAKSSDMEMVVDTLNALRGGGYVPAANRAAMRSGVMRINLKASGQIRPRSIELALICGRQGVQYGPAFNEVLAEFGRLIAEGRRPWISALARRVRAMEVSRGLPVWRRDPLWPSVGRRRSTGSAAPAERGDGGAGGPTPDSETGHETARPQPCLTIDDARLVKRAVKGLLIVGSRGFALCDPSEFVHVRLVLDDGTCRDVDFLFGPEVRREGSAPCPYPFQDFMDRCQ